MPEVGQDHTVLSDDVDSMSPEGFKACNLHRQIITSLQGLTAAGEGVCAKLRTDIEITNALLLLMRLIRPRPVGSVFERMVTAIDYSSVDPLRNDLPLLYHVCDWVHVGERHDLLKMFSAPLPQADFYHRFADQPHLNTRLAGYAEGLRAEAYLTSHAVRPTYWRDCDTAPTSSRFASIRSNILIARNFEITRLAGLGLTSTRHQVAGFNPNRFGGRACTLWRDVPKYGLSRKWRKLALRIYYSQRLILRLLRNTVQRTKDLCEREKNDCNN